MSRPDFTKEWASSRLTIPTISDPDYALGLAAYLGSQPPTTDDHDYIFNLQDKRAVWLGEQMLLAVGHEWQDDVTYDAYAVVRSPVNGQIYRSLAGGNLNNEPSVSGAQWALGVADSADTLNAPIATVAAAGTINLTTGAPDTSQLAISGTGVSISGFTVAANRAFVVKFSGANTLVNSASLVTQSGANITTAAGDTCIIRATAANVVDVLAYTPAGGWEKSLATNGYQKLPSGLIIQWGVTGASGTKTWPITFPNGALSVSIANQNNDTSGITAISATGYTYAGASSSRFIAVGF